VKKPQLFTILIALLAVAFIYFFVRRVPVKDSRVSQSKSDTLAEHAVSIDTILNLAKKQISADQLIRINELEHSISRGNVKEQQLKVYSTLARFWSDSARIFEPYAWYMAEGARLENSEKTLTFAAQLFLDNLQSDEVPDRRRWKALQAKDLFERSLRINSNNDSAKIGLGACYLFGNISSTPMEGIMKIREVAERDSNNMYAQLMLGKASLLSNQFDKAISRLETVYRHEPDNLDALLLLAEVNERMGKKEEAIRWYERSLPNIDQPRISEAIAHRIEELKRK
jgi:tetratricopeptide (TPR) repeat protein